MIKLLKNPVVKNIASAFAIAVIGLVFLNLVFIFDRIFSVEKGGGYPDTWPEDRILRGSIN